MAGPTRDVFGSLHFGHREKNIDSQDIFIVERYLICEEMPVIWDIYSVVCAVCMVNIQ